MISPHSFSPRQPVVQEVYRSTILILAAVSLLVTGGCGGGPQLAAARGKVLYKGKPLEFGSVTFQPERGQPARADIQSDGSFELSTFHDGDGATVGRNLVRVTCYESQSKEAIDASRELPLGRLLIPKRYTDYDTSGLVVEVKPTDNKPFVFDLSDG